MRFGGNLLLWASWCAVFFDIVTLFPHSSWQRHVLDGGMAKRIPALLFSAHRYFGRKCSYERKICNNKSRNFRILMNCEDLQRIYEGCALSKTSLRMTAEAFSASFLILNKQMQNIIPERRKPCARQGGLFSGEMAALRRILPKNSQEIRKFNR